MKNEIVLLSIMAAPALALGACGTGPTMRDFGLHRAWEMARDCEHPERPATLREVPWTTPSGLASASSGQQAEQEDSPVPEVRAGMRVTLWRQEDSANIHLAGIALDTASHGQKVKVRAGLRAAILEGIVRGPALVELMPAGGAH